MTRMRGAPHAVSLLSAALALLGCSPGSGEDDSCFGKCEGLGDGVHEVLASRADPIARWLRESGIDDEGFIDATFPEVLFGLAEQQGCARESIKTFVVSDDLISEGTPFPRLVSAACTDDAAKASEFFMAASFADPDVPGEVDLRSIEMFAWDSNRRAYTFYETFAAERGGVRVNAEPTVCRECHLTTSDMAPTAMHMTPIMNELTRPWTHWNASPGFPSFGFEVPEEALASDSFTTLVDPFKGQADQLEQLIRAGHDKVALARLRERRDPVDVGKAMALLRPVFCSEQINYASEDFDSGVLLGAAALDPGIRQAFLQIRPDNWPWAWVNDTTLRLPPPSGAVLEQVPVRGSSDVAVENLLMSTGVLTAQQVLQVRALDWQRPVFSELRCDLWKEASTRFASAPPDLSGATRISHAIPILFEAMMEIEGQPIAAPDGESIVAVPLADPTTVADLASALAAGTVGSDCSQGFCALTVDALGGELEAHYSSLAGTGGRDRLFADRDERICNVIARVTPADDRFQSPRECAEEICAETSGADSASCIAELTAAAESFDTSSEERKRAAECAHPERFRNRPSLPAVSCPEPAL